MSPDTAGPRSQAQPAAACHSDSAGVKNPVVRPREFVVSCLPEDDPEGAVWDVHVEYRGRGLWAVRRRIYTLRTDGDWDLDPRGARGGEQFLAAHLFEREDALERARQAAPRVRVDGRTLPVLLAWRAEQQADQGGDAS